MNLHSVQSYETEAEMRLLSSTKHNIISAQESKPIIVIVQDSLLASYLMTKENKTITRSQFQQYASRGETVDGKPLYNPQKIETIRRVLKQHGKKPDVFTGRGLMSLILPDNLYYENKNDCVESEPVVKIFAGVLVEGAFDKKVLGSSHNSLIQIINKEYGVEIAANFIDNIQFLCNGWLADHGFTVGLRDCMVNSENSRMEIRATLMECYTKAQGIEENTLNPGIREVRVIGALSQAKDVGMRIAQRAMASDNNLRTTVDSGAKGDYFNIAQVTGLLGQQNLEGMRVPKRISNGQRSLPHYPFGEMSKDREYTSRGFVSQSFIEGLPPEEYFFHAMSGREGVCDTATRTAESGYLQRRLIKALEDTIVQYDGTVRNASGKCSQLTYAGNGFDPTKVVKVDKKFQPCDIGRLVNRLNQTYKQPVPESVPNPEPVIDSDSESDSESESESDTERSSESEEKDIDFDEIEQV